jgi:coenzyme F420-0:L-glutamate ligase / coenzyme F420-1:gamma-L-glutamate ligase
LTLEVIPIQIEKEIKPGDDIVQLMLLSKQGIQDRDILVFTQKIISKQEGNIVSLSSINPTLLATGIASEYGKDPRVIQLILDESKRIVRMKNGIIISETFHGFVCANAGVDESNVQEGYATLLPRDPVKSAEILRNKIKDKIGKNTSVIISDTFGRPFRHGQTNVALGFSGISAITDYVGTKDNFARTLRVTEIATVDEICSAAELVMRKSLHVPIAIVRNCEINNKESGADDLIRTKSEDLFR